MAGQNFLCYTLEEVMLCKEGLGVKLKHFSSKRSSWAAIFLLVSSLAFADGPRDTRDPREEDPYGINDPEKKADELARNSRDWEKHPGFFHFGIGAQFNLMTVPTTVSGATNQASGVGFGGVVLLDYDFSRQWLFGFRFMVGFKRLLASSDENLPNGAVSSFPISVAIQKLMRVSGIATFRYGIGTGLEIMDTPDSVITDNTIFLTADFDFPSMFTGLRVYLYSMHPDANFAGMEIIAGVRF